jgi:hypothetical protein
VAIQQLRNENTAKKETIDQLESKSGLLETQLEKLLASGVFKKEARLHVKMLRDKNP